MSHKYRIDTVTRYNRPIYGGRETLRSCYYASSIKQIIAGLEHFGDYERRAANHYTEYFGGHRVVEHFITRIY